MTSFIEAPVANDLPDLNPGLTGRMAAAFSIRAIAFHGFDPSPSPLPGLVGLAPAPLATQVWNVPFGAACAFGGQLLHHVAGLVGHPIGWHFIAAPVAALVAPRLPEAVEVLACGVTLWVLAMVFMATPFAGQPAYSGWTGIPWVALAGYVLFAVVHAASTSAPTLRLSGVM